MSSEKKTIIKSIYKVARGILFSVLLAVVGLYIIAYVLLSIPGFNNYIKNKAETELSNLIGSKVEIGDIRITPFNEVVVNHLTVFDLQNEKCLEIETLGAGIRLWKLITEGEIELTYGEIIGLHAFLIQQEKNGDLNITFLIDAFKSKDEKKEKTPFEMALRNVVLRKSSISFKRPWLGSDAVIGRLDLSDMLIDELAADITFPKISDNGVEFDLRRLSFSMPGLTEVDKLSLKGNIGKDGISVTDFELKLQDSRLYIPEIDLPLREGETIIDILSRDRHNLEISESFLNPSDFSFLLPLLGGINTRLPLLVKINGNLNDLTVEEFRFGNPNIDYFKLFGTFSNLKEGNNINGDLSLIDLEISSLTIQKLLPAISAIPDNVKNILLKIGAIHLNGHMTADVSAESVKGEFEINSDVAELNIDGDISRLNKEKFVFLGNIDVEKLFLNDLVPTIPIQNLKAQISADGGIYRKNPYGSVNVEVEKFEYKNIGYDGFTLDISKDQDKIEGDFFMNNRIGDVSMEFSGNLRKDFKKANLNLEFSDLNLSEIIDMKNFDGYLMSGSVTLDGGGNDINDITGDIVMTDFFLTSPDETKKLNLKKLTVKSDIVDESHVTTLKSDWIDGLIEGKVNVKNIGPQITNLINIVFPNLVKKTEIVGKNMLSEVDFQFTVKPNNSLPEFFNLPIRLLVPIQIEGSLTGKDDLAKVAIEIPYLQQGKDKLISDTHLIISLDGKDRETYVIVETTYPVKKGELELGLEMFGENNNFYIDMDFVNTENDKFNGKISLEGKIDRNPLSLKPEFGVEFKPSIISMGENEWRISPSFVKYSDKVVEVDGLKLWHDDQFVEIDGIASESLSDILSISLANIDVDYIFDTLKINYVTFGGIATGEVTGQALFSKEPVAETKMLKIKEFSYNGALLGDCDVTSRWNNLEKEVEFTADISSDGRQRVYGKGGIWVTRDSLAFDIKADKVNVEFIQPFMSVFSSHVGGFATGNVSLFGTFKDIDMTGKIFADSISVKLDYTNTIYHGSDSVLLLPGKIEIPSFRLYDKNGHSAVLTGELTHRYFHDPSFNFRLSDARRFLCYDTSKELNPDWYGQLYGNGSALVRGVPGIVDISADMTLVGNSTFTFVLNDTQYAQDYQFLTFSDKRKETLLKEEEKPLDFKELFKKKVIQDQGGMSKFGIDIRASVTPEVLFTLVMDPSAGDKIAARGRGAMQVKYESDNDEMLLYGKYEIDEGNYNFSLQDIILRDFKIKEGSSISFNGNPLRADLDIKAAYRVNTNLSDLDKSFSSDRDLTRTNVPVDAILSVEGNMQQPDITFDIELPTLTQDVERKVKSIISTDDMMNRQIIYLLALNRFYTPEYMGSNGNGGELAAVASSTISSQLSNMLAQLTDKVTVAPSIRSDKGDFSDIEVDVALSSRLLNNRLLINGNFGYRDRSNSSTTFVGDFDVEYLLSKNGNLRLKAYNHFNDQNYYLREALTTQGLGIVYRRDFDKFFNFGKKKKVVKEKESEELGEEEAKKEGEK